MVSSVSIIFMISSIIISVGVPLFLLIWVRKKYQASLLSFFVGMIAWVVAVQILEAPVHLYFLSANEITSNFLFTNPIAYMLYGGLMAGVFEETARLVCFKFLLKKQNRIQDALSYGIGHGGVEAVLLVGLTYVSNLAMSVMINNG
ncbi:MAG: YhfC family glutamic-type intramembrane protease, partial [Turicibacter sp.]